MEIITKSSNLIIHEFKEKKIMEIQKIMPNSDYVNGGFYHQTRMYYDNCAECYDYLYPDHVRYSNKLFDKLDPIFRKHNVEEILDASCGIGHDMKNLLRKGYKVDGADISLHMINKAKNNLSMDEFTDSNLYNFDVREIANKISNNKYDVVLFRGNTLSNIMPSETELVFNQLSKLLKVGGIIVVDFRDGFKQFKIKRKYEFRGCGIKNSTLFYSYYRLKHSDSIHKPYNVNAIIYKLKFKLFPKITKTKICINSFYVIHDLIMKIMEKYFISKTVLNSSLHGLPYLKTIYGIKNHE